MTLWHREWMNEWIHFTKAWNRQGLFFPLSNNFTFHPSPIYKRLTNDTTHGHGFIDTTHAHRFAETTAHRFDVSNQGGGSIVTNVSSHPWMDRHDPQSVIFYPSSLYLYAFDPHPTSSKVEVGPLSMRSAIDRCALTLGFDWTADEDNPSLYGSSFLLRRELGSDGGLSHRKGRTSWYATGRAAVSRVFLYLKKKHFPSRYTLRVNACSALWAAG